MINQILLICPKCCRGQFIDRDALHPKLAEIEVQDCPQCWNGDFDFPEFFDADLNEISPTD